MNERESGVFLRAAAVLLLALLASGCLTKKMWTPDSPGYARTPAVVPLRVRSTEFDLYLDGDLRAGSVAFDVPDDVELPEGLASAAREGLDRLVLERVHVEPPRDEALALGADPGQESPLAGILDDPDHELRIVVTKVARGPGLDVELLVARAGEGFVERLWFEGEFARRDAAAADAPHEARVVGIEYREFEATELYTGSVAGRVALTPLVLVVDAAALALGGVVLLILVAD